RPMNGERGVPPRSVGIGEPERARLALADEHARGQKRLDAHARALIRPFYHLHKEARARGPEAYAAPMECGFFVKALAQALAPLPIPLLSTLTCEPDHTSRIVCRSRAVLSTMVLRTPGWRPSWQTYRSPDSASTSEAITSTCLPWATVRRPLFSTRA